MLILKNQESSYQNPNFQLRNPKKGTFGPHHRTAAQGALPCTTYLMGRGYPSWFNPSPYGQHAAGSTYKTRHAETFSGGGGRRVVFSKDRLQHSEQWAQPFPRARRSHDPGSCRSTSLRANGGPEPGDREREQRPDSLTLGSSSQHLRPQPRSPAAVPPPDGASENHRNGGSKPPAF